MLKTVDGKKLLSWLVHNTGMLASAKKTWIGEKAFWRSEKDCDSLPSSVGGAGHVMVVVMETERRKALWLLETSLSNLCRAIVLKKI